MPYFEYNDKKIFYVDEGKGDVVLLLPGNTATSAVHGSEIEYFSRNFRIICPDYMGYGNSDRVSSLPVNSWWENAVMCKELMESIGAANYAVIGTSGGGITALDLAIIDPERVSCVVADSVVGEYMDKAQIEAEIEFRKNAQKELKFFWSFANGEDWQFVVDMDSKMLLETADIEGSIFNDRLGEIKCCVLITGSFRDRLIENIADRICEMAKKIENCKVVMFSRGGHPLMWTRKQDFRREAINFILSCRSLKAERFKLEKQLVDTDC